MPDSISLLEKARRVLEWNAVLEALAGLTVSIPGAERCRSLELAVTLDDGAGSAVFGRSPSTGVGFIEASPAALATGNQFQAPLIADLNSVQVRQPSRWASSRARSNVDSSLSSSSEAHSRARSQFPFTRLTIALTPLISRS